MNIRDIQDQLQYWYSPNTVNHFRTLQLIMMGYGLDESEVKRNAPELVTPITTSGTGAGALLYFPPILRSLEQMRQSNPILKLQALAKSNNALSIEDALLQFGDFTVKTKQLNFLGIPIRKCDALLLNEAVVS